MMLPDPQLARLRAWHTSLLTNRCQIDRRNITQNSSGGMVETWQPMALDVPCRLMPERDRRHLETLGDRQTTQTYYRLTLPYDVDLNAYDRVIINSVTYQVISVWAMDARQTALRATVVTVD